MVNAVRPLAHFNRAAGKSGARWLEARKHHTQADIARHTGVTVRTVKRWEARQSRPPAYLAPSLQQLLPLATEKQQGNFDFIDLFAGIGGIRSAFEKIGGRIRRVDKAKRNAEIKNGQINWPFFIATRRSYTF